MSSTHVLLMPGSIRRDSLHRRFAGALRPRFEAAGARAEIVDLGDHPLPVYHGDVEAESGVPAEAIGLAQRLGGADALVVLSPEYNGGPSALLKNSIDWLTRIDRAVLSHLLIGLASTTPGSHGGAHGLSVMRSIFGYMRVRVHDEELAVARGHEAFEVTDGAVTFARDDDRDRADAFARGLVAEVVRDSVAAAG